MTDICAALCQSYYHSKGAHVFIVRVPPSGGDLGSTYWNENNFFLLDMPTRAYGRI